MKSPLLPQMILVCSLLVFFISFAHAADSHVVETATPETFTAAVAHLRQVREEGTTIPFTIELANGEYRLTETISLSSKDVGDGLKLKAQNAGEVVFTGAIRLEAKEKDEAGVWRYPLPAGWNESGHPRQILIDGKLRPAARHPNKGYLRIEKANADRRSGFTVVANDLPDNFDPNSAPTDLILLHDWSSSRLPVHSFDRSTRELRTVGPIGCSAPHYAIDHFEKQPRYWLEGHPAFADQPGEWTIDEHKNELTLISGSEETAPIVELPALETLLAVGGRDDQMVQNFSLEGITFTGTRFPMPAGGYAGAQASMHEPRDEQGERTSSHRPLLSSAVKVDHGQSCQIINCDFQELGNTGLWLGSRSKDCRVIRCRVTGVGGNGINFGEDNSRRVKGHSWYLSEPDQIPTGNRIERCEVSQIGQVMPGAVAIWVPLSRRMQLIQNHIHDCPYTGISLGWIWSEAPSSAGGNIIRENRIEYVMQVLSDGGGIYTLGRQPDSLIENNVIADVPLNAGRAESNGMFLDQGSTGFTIRNNTIRRVDKSPLRFHQAGKNLVIENQWELATPETPPVRFNNTPQENITVTANTVLEPQTRIFLIGNSLTWDTIPSRLEEATEWHVDCGKSLKYIYEHPETPCVSTSRLWPTALNSAAYDFVSVQPHYGTTIEEDLAVIGDWTQLQPKATFIIHTGWAHSKSLIEEYEDSDPQGLFTHSQAYFDELLEQLRIKYPETEFRTTHCMRLLIQISNDIADGKAPISKVEEIYRDSIHMTTGSGRYLMHNAMRETLGQQRTNAGFPDIPPELKAYLDSLLDLRNTWN